MIFCLICQNTNLVMSNVNDLVKISENNPVRVPSSISVINFNKAGISEVYKRYLP